MDTAFGKTPLQQGQKSDLETSAWIASSTLLGRALQKNKFRSMQCGIKALHTPEVRPEVDTSYESLKNADKWTLSTGTVVEDQLYEFGKLQIREYPSQSFIFDINDSELYIKHGTFTSDEIEKMMINNNNIPLQLPDDFKQYFNKFNCKSTVDIRKALLQKESWEDSYHQDKHFNLDSIRQSIHMLLQEYELDSFAK